MQTSEGKGRDVFITEGEKHVHLYVPVGAACFVSIYEPERWGLQYNGMKRWSLSVPHDHPDCPLQTLPYPMKVNSSGYVCFHTKFQPEVDVRPASYRWLVKAIEENKARNLRDTAIFGVHALELELEPYHWTFDNQEGTNFRLIKVTILRGDID